MGPLMVAFAGIETDVAAVVAANTCFVHNNLDIALIAAVAGVGIDNSFEFDNAAQTAVATAVAFADDDMHPTALYCYQQCQLHLR